MAGRKKRGIDRIPESFDSVDAAGEFWSRHDPADYVEQTSAPPAIRFRPTKRRYVVELRETVARRLATAARRQGVPADALANRLLMRQLAAAAKKA